MVSKKMKRNEQHNPLYPPRKEGKEGKETKKVKLGSSFRLLVLKKKNKEVRGSGQPFFCCSAVHAD